MREGWTVTSFSQEDTRCSLNIVSHSAAQTQRLGLRLGELLRGGELLLLDGQLGAGKTTFTQGLAKGMHITEVVNSPTFTLLKEYRERLRPVSAAVQPAEATRPLRALYHFDLYRLEEPEEMLDLGFEDYFYNTGTGVCVVEWAGRADAYWPAERLYIRLQALNETWRTLLFEATGTRYCELLRLFHQKNTYATVSS